MSKKAEKWTLIVTPKYKLIDFQLNELWRNRDLILLFVKRDFVAIYKQTILGPLWYLIQPLLTTLIFVVVFGAFANIPTEGMPPILFYLSGLTIWNYFASCFTKTSNTFVANEGIFGKVYFPRLAVPFSILISNLISFLIQFSLLIAILLYYKFNYNTDIEINAYSILTPFLLLIIAGLGLGLGVLISSLTIKYRDFSFLITFGVQLLMYASPIIYPLSSVPDKYKLFIMANPVTAPVEFFRYGLLGSGTVSWSHLFYSCTFMFITLIIGILFFNKVEKNFMDTV